VISDGRKWHFWQHVSCVPTTHRSPAHAHLGLSTWNALPNYLRRSTHFCLLFHTSSNTFYWHTERGQGYLRLTRCIIYYTYLLTYTTCCAKNLQRVEVSGVGASCADIDDELALRVRVNASLVKPRGASPRDLVQPSLYRSAPPLPSVGPPAVEATGHSLHGQSPLYHDQTNAQLYVRRLRWDSTTTYSEVRINTCQ